MQQLHEEKIVCPYCSETIVALIDPEELGQEYIEDCQVCCRPITFFVTASGDGSLSVRVQGENEV